LSDFTPPFTNKLLAALPAEIRQRLVSHLTFVALPQRMQLEHSSRPIGHVYFIESGIVSITASDSDNPVEIGIIGYEGMSGISVLHGGARSPYASYMQAEGSGYRLPADILRHFLESEVICRSIFLGFAHAFMIQIAETAIANAGGTILQRLARWLLMAADRLDGKEIPLTHEFLAMMLGTRRPGVTEACHELARRGLIENRRAKIAIVNRAGLTDLAARFYGVPENELRMILKSSAQARTFARQPTT